MGADGLCECGCGARTGIAPRTDARKGWVHGFPMRFLPLHHHRLRAGTTGRYQTRVLVVGGKAERVHRVRAERALGKPLPAGAVVHHADGTKHADAPLVICQDETYHRLLHARMRVWAAGGNPNTHKICGHCRAVKPQDDFPARVGSWDGLYGWCRQCVSAIGKARRSAA